ncbi:MAG: hypothetical protein M3Z46_08305 [Actinomycetota bacterium]|nr:hypothetical protein [Actinomycetota bacterium]
MGRRVMLGAVGVAVAVTLSLGSALPAWGRWAYGNGPSDLNVQFQGNPDQSSGGPVCANRLKGQAGASGYGDPATFHAPPGPYGKRNVIVYVSSTKDLSQAQATDDGNLTFFDGTVVRPLTYQITNDLEALSPYETYEGGGQNVFTVYAARGYFNIVPPANSIHAGDSVVLRVQDHSAFVWARAVDCAVTSK